MENLTIISILTKMNPYLPKIVLYLPKTGEKVSNLGFYALKFRLVLGSFLKLLKLGSPKSKLGSITSFKGNLEKTLSW